MVFKTGRDEVSVLQLERCQFILADQKVVSQFHRSNSQEVCRRELGGIQGIKDPDQNVTPYLTKLSKTSFVDYNV
jgi:hypothetical protein